MAARQPNLKGMVTQDEERAEVIYEEMDKLKEKKNKIRDAEAKLDEELVQLYEKNGWTTRRDGADEWYLDAGKKKVKRRRVKEGKSERAEAGDETEPARETA